MGSRFVHLRTYGYGNPSTEDKLNMLITARDRIKQRWCRMRVGAAYQPTGAVCAIGGLRWAAHAAGQPEFVVDGLEQFILRSNQLEAKYRSLPRFNDGLLRHKRRVLKAFDKAILKMRAQLLAEQEQKAARLEAQAMRKAKQQLMEKPDAVLPKRGGGRSEIVRELPIPAGSDLPADDKRSADLVRDELLPEYGATKDSAPVAGS